MRRDLSTPQQAVQACHVCLELAREFFRPRDEHPHLVLCGVKSEQQLRSVLRHLRRCRIAARSFCEPDLGGQLTAVASEPICGQLRRHLRRYRCLPGEESGG